MRIEKHQKMNNSKWEIREQVNQVKLNKEKYTHNERYMPTKQQLHKQYTTYIK